MRTVALIAFISLSLACGNTVEHCSNRPTDPLCQDRDGALTDSGPGDAGGNNDAFVPCGHACSAPTGVCNTATNTCVECLHDTDCSGGRSHCNTATNACVACLASTDCTMPGTARCDTTAHTCGACVGNGDCTHLTATPVCNTVGGACVQCVTNADCDATHGCETSTHSCVAITPMSKFACDACLRDAECQAGQICVPMSYHGGVVGSFCAWRLDATGAGAPNSDCRNARPAINTVMASSTDGVSAMVCLLRSSTCAAVRNFGTPCSPATAPTSSPMCGAHMDGFCRMQGAVTQCTVECTANEDCPCTGGTCASQYICGGGFCNLTATCNWDVVMHTCH